MGEERQARKNGPESGDQATGTGKKETENGNTVAGSETAEAASGSGTQGAGSDHPPDGPAENQPSVAVCIVTYNSAAWIDECLASLRRQTWRNLSVVVVDNASTDDTVWRVGRADANVRLIRSDRNLGFAAGQNLAISSAEADYYLVLNPDVWLAPDYVERLVKLMEERPEIGSATGCLVRADGSGVLDSAGLAMSWTRRAVDRGAGMAPEKYGEPGEVFGVSGAAAMYACRMVRDVKIDGEFFDEDFFAYKEDVDVAWRARLLGWKAWYEPKARAVHVRGWGSGSDRGNISLTVRRHSYKNRYLAILKNETFDLFWWLRLPALLAVELAWHLLLLVLDPKVLGVWARMPDHLRRAWRKRRTLQEMRRAHTGSRPAEPAASSPGAGAPSAPGG